MKILRAKICIYCGEPVGKTKRGEHIFPDALGCKRTIKETSGREVCVDCNTKVLSTLDNDFIHNSYVIGDSPVPLSVLESVGYVNARDKKDMDRDGGHSFRLSHARGVWRVYSSFFDGDVKTVAAFYGPSMEDWKTLNIFAPYDSADWVSVESNLVDTGKYSIEWMDSEKIIPSIKFITRGYDFKFSAHPFTKRSTRA